MEKISVRELFDKALLSVPHPHGSRSLRSLQNGDTFKHVGGVYIFFNQYKEPLYVGISNDVGKRVREHLGTPKGNKDLCQYIEAGNYISVQAIYEPDKKYQEVYESYLIHQLNPRFNIQKTGRCKL